MNNPFDYVPDAECHEAFRTLVQRIEELKVSSDPIDVNFCRELEAGKMLGVLIAADADGVHHTLYAFSGQLGDGGFYFPGFVGPVFDYLQPNGYFKTKEREISGMNFEIAEFVNGDFTKVKDEFNRIRAINDKKIAEYQERYRLSKLERDAKRNSKELSQTEAAELIRQSQFEKGEIHRLKKRLALDLFPFEDKLKYAQSHLDAMRERRRLESENLQQWLFNNFEFLNARGERKNLTEIFANTPLKTPPSGAGECCGPKLLQTAYLKGLKPISIAEFWYGKSKEGEVRIHGEHYPACRGKCLPILTWMLQGLDIEPPLNCDSHSTAGFTPEIIYENKWFCVINKPSGMLSVPGKGEAMSVQSWLEERYGKERFVKVVHRLDQDTSGLLIAAFTPLAFKTLQAQFAMRNIKKTYIADLEGDYREKGIPVVGRIELPLSPDWLDRPRQRVDRKSGKPALTEYEFIKTENGRSRIKFQPHTGRTHQLRVHAASQEGIGMPIVGDRLYGKSFGNPTERLHLHAHTIDFTFPLDKQFYSFYSPFTF